MENRSLRSEDAPNVFVPPCKTDKTCGDIEDIVLVCYKHKYKYNKINLI